MVRIGMSVVIILNFLVCCTNKPVLERVITIDVSTGKVQAENDRRVDRFFPVREPATRRRHSYGKVGCGRVLCANANAGSRPCPKRQILAVASVDEWRLARWNRSTMWKLLTDQRDLWLSCWGKRARFSLVLDGNLACRWYWHAAAITQFGRSGVGLFRQQLRFHAVRVLYR